ncbi:MAG TPA: hypothetical protein PL124_03935 [Candidatus Cloacimonadota bacterium]|nr:hypothetical protein [Candidatus Cloacimonadota bacterium]
MDPQQVLQAVMQAVPADILLQFLQIISQMSEEEIGQLIAMLQKQQGGVQPQGEPAPQNERQQGQQNLYGNGY